MKRTDKLESSALILIQSLMASSARTAPKTRGIDNIEIFAVDDESTKKNVIKKMKQISKEEDRPSMERDANSILPCRSIVVIGVRSNPAGLNCGFCGYPTCDKLKRSQGSCAFNSIDLGIAASSAVSTAGAFHADNRIMYSIGRACVELGLFGKDVKQALGIPLSVTGKIRISTGSRLNAACYER